MLQGIRRARQSPSSSSTSPESTTATLKTPPFAPSRNLELSPPPSTSDSPTSTFLASALGGLSLRDSQSPVKRVTATNGGRGTTPLFTDSTNKGSSNVNSELALGLSGMGEGKGIDSSNEKQQNLTKAGEDKTLKHVTSVDELAMLAISSRLTELSMSIEEVSTLIFEIQELRHTSSTSAKPPTGEASNAVSEMDKALMRLDARLEDVRRELEEIESQVKPIVDSRATSNESSEIHFLREKWNSTLAEWDSVQRDAEMLGEEMKEDKWLVVFNSVIKQAEDMMKSLEKILNQSHQFVWDVNRRKGKSTSSTGSSDYFSSNRPILPASTSASSVSSLSMSTRLDPADIQPLLSAFISLHQSLHAKVKYYSPACDRVLKILGKGIADRSTKNGEVLRRFAEMKSRWKELQERITRIEAEMKGVEEILKDAAGPDEIKVREKEKDDKSRNQSEFGNTLTPPRESPVGRVSPLRRLANKMSPNSTPTRPDRFWRQSSLGPSSSSSPPASSAMLPSTSGTSTSPSTSSTGAKATPPRPPKSSKRVVSGASPASTPPPQTPQSRPPLSHRRSSSALSASVGASGRPIPRRAISPMPTPSASLADRPRWNPSTKRTDDEREVLTQSALGKGRPSLNPVAGGGGGTPLANRNGRNSSMGLRPSSRMSMNSSMSRSFTGARPVSPAFSDASSVVRDRPSTPSRIPRPSSVIRPRSTTPYSNYDGPGNTSIMQRMASSPSTTTTSNRSRPPPAPSNRYSLSRSAGPSSFSMPRSSSASLLPTTSTLGGGLSPPRAVSPSPSAISSTSFYYRGQTPEPSLMAHAKRLANVRAPASSSRPPPVPRLPSNRGGSDQSTPRAGAPSSRPPSSLGFGRAGAFSPLPNGESTATAYSSNPHDPLDIAVGEIVNSLPLALHVSRVDPHLSRAQAGHVEMFNARYLFSLTPLEDQRRAVMLKLVDRVGPRARKGEKKVLARVGSGWQDLESHCLSLMAQAI